MRRWKRTLSQISRLVQQIAEYLLLLNLRTQQLLRLHPCLLRMDQKLERLSLLLPPRFAQRAQLLPQQRRCRRTLLAPLEMVIALGHQVVPQTALLVRLCQDQLLRSFRLSRLLCHVHQVQQVHRVHRAFRFRFLFHLEELALRCAR